MSSCCLHTLKTRMTAPVAFVYSYRYSYNFVLSSHCWFLRFPKRALNLSVTYACRRSVLARDIEYAVHPTSSQVALKLSRASKSTTAMHLNRVRTRKTERWRWLSVYLRTRASRLGSLGMSRISASTFDTLQM